MLEINTPEKQSLLLFISYYFPPIHVNAVVRIKNFYEGFIENGFRYMLLQENFPDKLLVIQVIKNVFQIFLLYP